MQQSRYFNRELSWLEFNQRVLEQAMDASNPLLERLKFLCIVSSNLDEFFEVRVAGLMQQLQTGTSIVDMDGLTPKAVIELIRTRVRRMVADQYRCWRRDIHPALRREKIRFRDYPDVPKRERKYFHEYYMREVHPVLTPLAVDPSHPFPQLLNKGLNVVVELDSDSDQLDFAIVQVPRNLPRVVPFSKSRDDGMDFVLIGNLIQHHVGSLFHGVKVKGAYLFRTTRNSNIDVDEDEAPNILRAIEEELRKVNRGAAVRLEVEDNCPKRVVNQLIETFNLESEDVYYIDGPVNFVRIMPFASQIERPDLRYPPFRPHTVVKFDEETSLFENIRKGDILLHHPYDNFQTVVDLLEQAIEDPKVLAIKQTLYRTSSDSPFVHALIAAARAGKQVTVVIELKARFDEAANIKWARMMRESGVDVVYGVSRLKTHAKMMLIVRKEGGKIRRYAHLGTGNYHPSTAKLYTDIGLLTCHPRLTAEVAETFNCVTGVSKFPEMHELLLAPDYMSPTFLKLIRNEIANAQQDRPSGIYVKVNSLIEQNIIDALYEASAAGVPVRLLVRGTCALRAGVPGLSENIEVRSIVGRFLEHSRIFRFENAGKPRIYLGSADWMPRNLFYRVETVFPVHNKEAFARVDAILETCWRDNVKAKVQQPDGTYLPRPRIEPRIDAQAVFVEESLR